MNNGCVIKYKKSTVRKPDKLKVKNVLVTHEKHRKARKFGDQLTSRDGIIFALIGQSALLGMFS